MIDFEEDIVSRNPAENAQGLAACTEEQLWVNRYRPTTLDRFCLSAGLRNAFQAQIDANDLQNCCLIGSPGIGKTTLALILARSIRNSDALFVSCASGEGRVDSIQTKIIPFCQAASRGQKIVVLDELDSASSTQANSFQKSLRNVIEAYPDCRFVATANYQSSILPPILSRLPPIALSYSIEDMVGNLVSILQEEGVKVQGDPRQVKLLLGNLVKSCHPDMRLAIGRLQASCLNGILDPSKLEMDGRPEVETALADLLQRVKGTESPLQLRRTCNEMAAGFCESPDLSELCSPYGMARGLFNHLLERHEVGPEDLMDLVDRLHVIESCIDRETQLFGFLLKVRSMKID